MTIAGLLLFGKETAIKKALPAATTILTVETAIDTPLAGSRWFNVIAGVKECLNFVRRYLSGSEATIPENAIRELLFNAYLHRCYRTNAPMQVRIRADEIEIQNPGDLLGGLTPATLLYGSPNYRNFLLADAARQYGYCEKAGFGIDKVYHHLLVNGFDFPIWEAKGNSFSVIVRTRRDLAFARFIREFASTLDMRLTDLRVTRALRQKASLSGDQLAQMGQRSATYMSNILSDLDRKNVITRSGDEYRLSDLTLQQLSRYDEGGQLRLL